MRSCERPLKRSASNAVASSVSKRYSLSIRTQGSSRRHRASSSLRRVSVFSASSSFFRATIHSFCDTMLCFCFRFCGSDLFAFVLMFSFLWLIPRLRDQSLSVLFSSSGTTNEPSYFGHTWLKNQALTYNASFFLHKHRKTLRQSAPSPRVTIAALHRG